jgi:hypothetical protein
MEEENFSADLQVVMWSILFLKKKLLMARPSSNTTVPSSLSITKSRMSS